MFQFLQQLLVGIRGEKKYDEKDATGAFLTSYAAYGLSEVCFVLSSPTSFSLGDPALEWHKQGEKNAWNENVSIERFQENTENKTDGSPILIATSKGKLTTVFLSSQSLIGLIPTMYKLASDKKPCVFHVATSKSRKNYVTLGDTTDILSVRNTGWGILSSETVQECYDLALIAHLVAIKTGVPFLHFFDACLASREISQAKTIKYDAVSSLLSKEDLEAARRGSTTQKTNEQPKPNETASESAPKRNPDDEDRPSQSDFQPPKGLYFQPSETSSQHFQNVTEVVQSCMDQMAKINGKQYSLFEYVGSPTAETVIVVMGSGSSVVEGTVKALNSRGSGVGVVKVRLYRPWSEEHFLKALPTTAKRVAVLEQFTDEVYEWGPLYADVTATLSGRQLAFLSGGQYGTGPKGLSPSMVKAVFDNLKSSSPQLRFTLGQVGHLELSVSDPSFSLLQSDNKQFLVWDTISDQSSLSSNRSLLNTFSTGQKDLHFSLDVYQNTDTVCSHLVLGSQVFAYPYVVDNADVVGCGDIELLGRYNILESLKQGGTLILKTHLSPEQLEPKLTPFVKSTLLSKDAGLFTLDAENICKESNLDANNYARFALQVAFFITFFREVHQDSVLFLQDLIEKNKQIDTQEVGKLKELIKRVSQELKPVNVSSSWGHNDAGAGLAPPSFSFVQHPEIKSDPTTVPLELPYMKLLRQAFGNRLFVVNARDSPSIWNGPQGNTEVGFGYLLAYLHKRDKFVSQVEKIVNQSNSDKINEELRKELSAWLANKNHTEKSAAIGEKVVKLINAEPSKNSEIEDLLANAQLFAKKSLWLIGGDGWSFDIGDSGVHHALSTREDINVLVLDTQTYSQPSEFRKGKKDLGLYAMNYGNSYVASTSVYASYTQTLHALLEADGYQGPSIVLGLNPNITKDASKPNDPLEALKESKMVVDTGAWPLYRWNPKNENNSFTLDSERIKADLKDFLARDNQLSLIANSIPKLPQLVTASLEGEVAAHHQAIQEDKIQSSFAKLASGLKKPPFLILYGSDGGNAKGLAKKLETEGVRRGLSVRCLEADNYPFDKLAAEPTFVFVVSTAGQGEFPGNSKEFWKSLSGTHDTSLLSKTKYSVFALGDKHYWPKPEDKVYFCKAGVDADRKIKALGAEEIIPLGIGDDQDDDGFMTGWKAWEPELWKALGAEVVDDKPQAAPLTDDQMKINSNYLRGTILQSLADTTTGSVVELDTKILKFHGIYQQDDRDLRDSRKQMGVEKAFSFMIRVRVPGGVCTPANYLAIDELTEKFSNGTIKLTTRQAFQLHGVLKSNLKKTVREINMALMDTIAACGDVCRNVMCTPLPIVAEVHQEVLQFAQALSNHMTPQTPAYHEIWLDKQFIGGDAVKEVEPLYGPTYLPRKFKVTVAIPPHNDVDVYANDLSYIAIFEENKLLGFNVLVGGGMGMTHNNKKTFPRLADVIGFCTTDRALIVGENVMLVQRDYGDRTNRKHARLKYTIEDRGIDWFRSEVEKRCGFTLEPARPFRFTSNGDRLGWIRGLNNTWHYSLFVEHGRIRDSGDLQMKTGLREIARVHHGDFRLTPNSSLIIGSIPDSEKENIQALLTKYGMDNKRHSGLRLNSMACAALPYCGLAFAEAERYLPSLVTRLEHALEDCGLRNEAITIRMTGCPNGCARPYIAEIALVGRAPGVYNLYIGAGFVGDRLSKLYKESVDEEEIVKSLTPLFAAFAKEKGEDEKFGDFVIRKGFVKACLSGNTFHS